MATIPFIGPSYDVEARSFDVQRSINLYPVMAEVQATKSVSALRKVPGFSLFATAPAGGPIRNGFSSTSGRAFVVSSQYFVEINSDGSTTTHGSLNTQSARVCIAENNLQIMVVDGVDGWIFTKSTNNWAQIVDSEFPVASYVTYQDGYFIVNDINTQNMWISALNDGMSWDALDYTTVESSPDNLTCVFSDRGNLFAVGNRSIEVYQNTGAAAFPFQRIPGAIIQTGCEAPFTFQKFGGSVAWLGTDEQGQGVVWLLNGYTPQRISTAAIERKIATIINFSASYAFVYHERGHLFYCLQIPGLDTTLCFDAQTQQWHERMRKNADTNSMELMNVSCFMFFEKLNLVGSRTDGKIYRMSLDIQDDDGDEMVWIRISPHQQDEKRLLSYGSFELDVETGVGLNTGQGSDPQIMLRYSDDGGNTWSSELWRSPGKMGQYRNRAIWRQLGQARDRVFWVSGSDPVFTQLNAAFVNST
jgi:hypothetical protein